MSFQDDFLAGLPSIFDAMDEAFDAVKAEQLALYFTQMMQVNQQMNLTSITKVEDVLVLHLLDSMSLLAAMDRMAAEKGAALDMADIGCGAGLPSIPLRILRPGHHFFLLDALQKRCRFMREVAEKIGITEGLSIQHGRAEDWAKKLGHREAYDLVTARAVAKLGQLSEYCLPFVRLGGQMIAMKAEVMAERAAAKRAIKILGGRLAPHESFCLPGTTVQRSLVTIQKIHPTPKHYPRHPKQMKNKPL